MRIFLYEICLFNDKLVVHDRVFTSKNYAGREQDNREIERESVRDRALLEMRGSVGNKIDPWRKYL